MKGITLSLLFLLQSLAFGQNNTLLWQIAGPGLQESSYLYGTIHIQDRRAFEFSDSVMIKFAASKAFAMELILDSTVQTKMAINMFMKDTTLRQLVPDSDYAAIKSKVEAVLGSPMPFLNKIKPVYITVLLMQAQISKDASEPLDIYLSRLAKQQNKPVIGIETADEQLDAFDKVPLTEQAEGLREYVKNYDSLQTITEEMIRTYRAGDLDSLQKLIDASDASLQEKDVLLTQRNYTMAHRIGEIVKQQPTFVAIGAGHLSGNEGVIALLRKDGFTVTPVRATYTPVPGTPEDKTTKKPGKE